MRYVPERKRKRAETRHRETGEHYCVVFDAGSADDHEDCYIVVNDRVAYLYDDCDIVYCTDQR